MKTVRASIITAEEATWPKMFGPYVVELQSGEQHWGVFQGTLEECEALERNLNEGFEYFEKST